MLYYFSDSVQLDAPSPYSFYFQDLGAPIFEGLVELHDSIAFIIIFAATVVLWFLWNLMTTFDRRSNTHTAMVTKHPNHSIELEWFLTGLPVVVLLMIAFPSFRLLYLMDDTMDATFTLKAVAQQWNWSYEYSDFHNSQW
jgi:cytochrome c oxidase subunit 2